MPSETTQTRSAASEHLHAAARIAIVGDTQRTLRAERLILRREQNDAERRRLVADLVASRPDLIVHLGDAVADGSRSADWADFDQLVAPARAAGVPILPALGNHDYGAGLLPLPGRKSAALHHLYARFPWLARSSWYDRQHGPLRLMWLDTNASRLSAAEWARQSRWFESRLVEADADGQSRGILIFAHHPPFTNSRVTSDAMEVQRSFVEPFRRSSKALAFFSGHTHSYERFHLHGKAFVVAGGGGGPRVRLRRGESQRHADQIDMASPRSFHYLVATAFKTGVQVVTRGLEKGETMTTQMDQFFLPYSEP